MVVILFGVSGAGKTLVGTLLAAELGWEFHDADLYHPVRNVEKLRRGVALTEDDRAPWLEKLCALLRAVDERGGNAVLACSGLRESYRQRLTGCAEARLVYLKGDFDLIRKRLGERRGHFMSADLLRSQFETLEEPRGGALVVEASLAPADIVKRIREALQL